MRRMAVALIMEVPDAVEPSWLREVFVAWSKTAGHAEAGMAVVDVECTELER